MLLNESQLRHHWLQVRLLGITDNRQGLGARVIVKWADGRTLTRRAHTDGSYLSASDSRVHFGVSKPLPSQVIVEWPRGARESWPLSAFDRVTTLKQGTGKPAQ